MSTYLFLLICPRCQRESMTTTEDREPPPVVKCGDCLMHDVEVVDLEIVRCIVGPSS
jgi:hypothetical protein